MQVSLRRSPTALLIAGVVFLAGASPASAVVEFTVSPGVPSVLAIGQTAPATLTIVNQSTGADGGLGVVLTSITLVPSCGALGTVSGNCPIASRDPGVLRPSAVSGRTGTACAGRDWTLSAPDMAQGKYTFFPSLQPALGPAVGGGPAATCVLDFTVEVLRSPTLDTAPAAGLQTNQIGFASGQVTSTNNAGQAIGHDQTTIAAQRVVTISARAEPAAVTLGSAIRATATLVPADASPTGTITFSLFGPDDATCSGSPVFVSAKPVAAGGATSDDFTPTAAGTYRFRASYDGDATNTAAGPSACEDPNAAAAVSSPAPAPGPETPAPDPGAPAGTAAGTPAGTAAGTPAGTQALAPSSSASGPSVGFATSPKTVRVGRTGSFSFAFTATSGSPGTIGLKSAKKVRIGSKTQFMQVPAKAFTAGATTRVTAKFKLSAANLKALKRLKSLKFAVSAKLGGKTFTTTLTLTPPKKT